LRAGTALDAAGHEPGGPRADLREEVALMTALVVTETCFGNTAVVADAIAEALAGPGGLVVDNLLVEDAPETVPARTRLLILAAPTHDYSLPRPATRRRARAKGGQRALASGMREWIEALHPVPDLRVVTVDTALRTGFAPSTAARTAAKLMRKAGFANTQRGATFYVSDSAGPLDDGEAVRAAAWATTLAAALKLAPETDPA
jgi:hypothetical protein